MNARPRSPRPPSRVPPAATPRAAAYRADRSTRRPAAVLGPAPVRRRRLGVLAALVATVLIVVWIAPMINHVVRDLTLPLSDQGIIRQQAREKHLDPALIAAVIFAETKFQARTSPTGAEGLMQIEPATARFLAHLSDGYDFTIGDLGTPDDQHRLRQLLPALSARPLQRQRDARGRRVQRGAGQRRSLGARRRGRRDTR